MIADELLDGTERNPKRPLIRPGPADSGRWQTRHMRTQDFGPRATITARQLMARKTWGYRGKNG
jgi:hypothetical protein